MNMAVNDTKHQYAGLKHMPLFLINGEAPPKNVKYGYTEDTEQLVKSQRNSKGVVVAEKVGRRLLKFNNLEWAYLTRDEYEWLQAQIAKFYCQVRFYDAREGAVITRKFYWGDFSAEPFEFDRDDPSGVIIPKSYINVKVNLIDCGEGSPAHNPITVTP